MEKDVKIERTEAEKGNKLEGNGTEHFQSVYLKLRECTGNIFLTAFSPIGYSQSLHRFLVIKQTHTKHTSTRPTNTLQHSKEGYIWFDVAFSM